MLGDLFLQFVPKSGCGVLDGKRHYPVSGRHCCSSQLLCLRSHVVRACVRVSKLSKWKIAHHVVVIVVVIYHSLNYRESCLNFVILFVLYFLP